MIFIVIHEYNNDNYYSTNITSEGVKFSLNVADYANGVYFTRLSVVDILSNSSTFRDSYFEVRRWTEVVN